ncbi:hypothetical protein [Erysipelothrix piscisicarius]|uniref:hypothetical protein n=1 Tax=Erysipelothrix piscisicarius TaxID=2485784 RepID=UPI002F937A5E
MWTSPHHFFVDYQQYDDPFALKTHAEHFGLEIIAICPEQTNPKPHNMATGSLEQQNRVYAYFRNMIDIAHTVGDDEQISKAIFVSETDKKLLKELMDAGKEVEIRMLSSDSKQVVKL